MSAATKVFAFIQILFTVNDLFQILCTYEAMNCGNMMILQLTTLLIKKRF